MLPYNSDLAAFIQILVHGQVQLSDRRSDWWMQIENLHQDIAAAVLDHLIPHCLTNKFCISLVHQIKPYHYPYM